MMSKCFASFATLLYLPKWDLVTGGAGIIAVYFLLTGAHTLLRGTIGPWWYKLPYSGRRLAWTRRLPIAALYIFFLGRAFS